MSEDEKKILLSLASNTIAKSLGLPFEEIDASSYKEMRGAFVTLKKKGHLRGCIGYIIAIKPLYKQIADLSLEAAYQDPRFPKLKKEEFPFIDIEISILSVPKEIKDLSEFQLSRDGIFLIVGSNRSVFLPQVADETGWSKEELLRALSQKAGLYPDEYKREYAKYLTFTAEVFS
ncbi:MAG: AmmeMemoRadiSam system protein A [Spirochaetaceae bacterium]|nr:AmmeMemoRadiSam system protein A [Spirochaetaceae bacterium]